MLFAALALTCCDGGGSRPDATAAETAIDPGTLLLPHDGPASSVLLVTLDTTRPDRIGAYGHAKARTPFLDGLARAGVLWERAYCAAPITLSSHTSLLTGVYPCAHGVRENGAFRVSPEARLLSEALAERGFRTGAFVGTFILDPKFGLDQGFEVYDAPDSSKVGVTWKVTERPAGAVADAALRYIDTLKPGERYFLWVHFYDPHYPHEIQPEFAFEGGEKYDVEIRYCDAQVERIVRRLAERKLAEKLVVAVTSDHGESFEEHGEESHGIFVYDSTMRVPLIVAPPPAGTPPGTRSTALVSNVDLTATLLDRLGIARTEMPAVLTPPLPTDAGDEERALYMESLTPFYDHRWHPLQAVVWRGFKFIRTRRSELYSLNDDPGELVDLVARSSERAEQLSRRLDGLLVEHKPLPWEDAGVLSPEDRERLAALAYGSHVSPGGNPFDPDLPDPKDHISDLDEIDTIVALVRDGAARMDIDGADRAAMPDSMKAERREQGLRMMDDARKRLLRMRDRYAEDPNIDTMLGMALSGLNQWTEAAEVLERVVRRNPDHAANHHNLANAYLRAGREQWGIREMEKAHFLDPRALNTLEWLVKVTMKREDWPAAAWWLEVMSKAGGQEPVALEEVNDRLRKVNAKLRQLNQKARPPKPIPDDELIPEGMRARERKGASG
jgi:arylsulfatase A-like enzyme